ncbi:MAG: amidase [Chlorobi bacterium]|nr:amidase [Chlorobiota bacterium]
MKKYSTFSISLIIIAFILVSVSFIKESKLTRNIILSAEKVIGLNFSTSEIDSLLDGVQNLTQDYEKIRNYKLDNSVPPAFNFNPVPPDYKFEKEQKTIDFGFPKKVKMPKNKEELAFYSISDLSVLIKTKQITSEELTRIYLNRIKKYNSQLLCFITVTEDLAIAQAKQADKEIAEGKYRGPLHGIPFGVKDLLAVKGYKTTWGSNAHKEQQINQTATVVKKLEEAGAVLLGKLSLGALAWGDVWFGGKTLNPWNLSEGSSGSSAGPASATSAGLVAFSIGSETWGSIVSPSTRCGATGLRPTYGRVSRTGAMALSWSMDKIGPICRNANDCALVFETIRGTDNIDRTLLNVPFNYNAREDISKLKIGYLKNFFGEKGADTLAEQATLDVFRKLGFELIPAELPSDIPVNSLALILNAEAAAAFDQLTITNKDDVLVRQIKNAWPNVFREARFIPAVEYINANRIRYRLIEEMDSIMKNFNAIICPSFGGNQLLMTNLSGHPAVVFPNGFKKNGSPVSITIIGNLYDEATILRVAKAFQDATDFEDKHPAKFGG